MSLCCALGLRHSALHHAQCLSVQPASTHYPDGQPAHSLANAQQQTPACCFQNVDHDNKQPGTGFLPGDGIQAKQDPGSVFLWTAGSSAVSRQSSCFGGCSCYSACCVTVSDLESDVVLSTGCLCQVLSQCFLACSSVRARTASCVGTCFLSPTNSVYRLKCQHGLRLSVSQSLLGTSLFKFHIK